MKKILAITTISVMFFSNIVLAYTNTEVKAKIDDAYTSLNTSIKWVYNKYVNKYEQVKNTFKTGDNYILIQFTGVNLTWLKNTIDTRYQTLSSEIINKKYELTAKVDEAKNNFDAGLISTGEYENKLDDVVASLSGYKTTYTAKISLLDKNLSGDFADFENKLKELKNTYKTNIERYKSIQDSLKKLETTYNNFKSKKEKLENIVGTSQEVVKEKSDEIKQNINNYFSGYVENEFAKYLKEDENMAYFTTWKEIKKQLILWYISDKIDGTIEKTISNYLPTDIDYAAIDSGYNQIKSVNIAEKVQDYADFMNEINALSAKLKEATTELDDYLNKFGANPTKDNILTILKKDIIEQLKNITKIVQDDIKQTFKSRMDFVKVKEKAEATLMDAVNKVYQENIWKTSLKDLENLLEILKTYKNTVVLPKNVEAINALIDVVNQKILEARNQEIIKKIWELSAKIDNLPIGNNFDEIEKLSKEIDNLQVPESFEKQKQILKMKLEMKKNLDKLFVSGAIKYYYLKWDLSDKVKNILMKYYEKYKAQGKENLFMQKIDKAFDKLSILEENLQADKRSYYIIIIHNGLIKFKMALMK